MVFLAIHRCDKTIVAFLVVALQIVRGEVYIVE